MSGESGDSLLLEEMTISRGAGPVVRNVSLEIRRGEVTALLGPNGAGKSSLVLAVGGVLRAETGRVLLDGKDLCGKRPERIRQAGIAIVPEGRRLLRELTVADNLDVACYALPRGQAKVGREHALEMFPELVKRLDIRAGSMSGGEQQMLVLAQALVSQPRFIFVDELSLGLAPVVVKRLVPTLRTVAESGVGVLLIEQFAPVALGVSNHAYVMDRGRVQFSGMAAELSENPDLLHSSYLLAGGGGEPPPPGCRRCGPARTYDARVAPRSPAHHRAGIGFGASRAAAVPERRRRLPSGARARHRAAVGRPRRRRRSAPDPRQLDLDHAARRDRARHRQAAAAPARPAHRRLGGGRRARPARLVRPAPDPRHHSRRGRPAPIGRAP
jgi:branched-chain amino acid transport system ATP-binding protein